MKLEHGVRPALLLAPLLGLVSLLLAAVTGGLSHSFLDPDESAHYVNTLFIADWLRAGLPAPMAFARDFYAHFPKLSIGHWPPAWYAFLAPAFAIFHPSPFGAAVLSAVVAGLPATLVAWGLFRSGARRLAVVAAFATLLLPLTVESARNFLLDQPVAFTAGLAAIAWLAAAERPSWARYALFGALAAFATLVKGNGALAVLIPAIEIALAGRWRLLRDGRLWVVGAATFLVILPWYLVSFRISAGGFNYAPGLAYAELSLANNAAAIWDNIGPIGLILSVFGAARGWRDERAGPVVRLALAVIIATFVIQATIPVALAPRYVLPMLPWWMILAGLGLCALWAVGGGWRIAASVCAVAALFAPVRSLLQEAPKADLGAPAIAETMRHAPGIWMVDGRAGGEGAVIAAAAYADGGQRHLWVARASQWLSTSDFMGNGYVLTARTPMAARATLDRLGVRGVVLVNEHGTFAYLHSAILTQASRAPAFTTTTPAFVRGDGSAIVANRVLPVASHPELLAMGSGSSDFGAMTKR